MNSLYPLSFVRRKKDHHEGQPHGAAARDDQAEQPRTAPAAYRARARRHADPPAGPVHRAQAADQGAARPVLTNRSEPITPPFPRNGGVSPCMAIGLTPTPL